METTAKVRGVRISAQKARLLADQIVGVAGKHAFNILPCAPTKAAGIVKRVSESAIATAERTAGADIGELRVKEIYVDKDPSLKRFAARAKGRGTRIEKQTCHIVVKVGA